MIRALFLLFLAGAVAFGALWVWNPVRLPAPPRLDAAAIPEDLDAYLAGREGVVPGITPGTEKRIVWAGAPGVRTPLAIVYLHGFSATSEEIRPVPDRAAAALGANLYFARLAGHGRDGEALATATVEDWLTDLAEALAIGARIGDRVIIVGTSTGATLALAGMGTPQIAAALPGAGAVAGFVFVSPNLRLADKVAGALLDAPGVGWWGPLIVGRTRSFATENEGHARFWTTRYPTRAVVPMADLMAMARAVDPGSMRLPLMLVRSPADRVVSPGAAEALGRGWGGPVTDVVIAPGPGIDPAAHVIAGDILSPAQTGPIADQIVRFAQEL
jgi:alpha-beta hydrolase superfamily lysophospholipase